MAFTIVELLVVISIISILAALLMPGLKAARDTARSTACLSNLRQLSLAISSYKNDFDAFPVYNNGAASNWGWSDSQGALSSYLPLTTYNRSILHCPALPPTDLGGNLYYEPDYAMNYYMFGEVLKGVGYTPDQIPSPAQRVLVVDSFPGQPFVQPWISIPGAGFGGTGNIARRHHGGSNYLFVDGHVQWSEVPPGTTTSDPYAISTAELDKYWKTFPGQ